MEIRHRRKTISILLTAWSKQAGLWGLRCLTISLSLLPDRHLSMKETRMCILIDFTQKQDPNEEDPHGHIPIGWEAQGRQ